MKLRKTQKFNSEKKSRAFELRFQELNFEKRI